MWHSMKIPQRNVPKTFLRKTQEKAPEITKKGKREEHNQALRNYTESSIHTMKVHTRSSFRPIILPSHKISPWSSQASLRFPKENRKENSKGKMSYGSKRWLPSSHHLGYMEASRKTNLPPLHGLGDTPTKGTLGNCRRNSIGRMPGDRTSLSLDTSLAIAMCVLYFEASRCRATPNRSDRFPKGRWSLNSMWPFSYEHWKASYGEGDHLEKVVYGWKHICESI
jgi:hypothetical protein